MTEKEFLKFHSGFFGEEVDKLGQMVSVNFTGEELYEYINEAIRIAYLNSAEESQS